MNDNINNKIKDWVKTAYVEDVRQTHDSDYELSELADMLLDDMQGVFEKFAGLAIKDLTQRLLESRLINIPMACQIYEEYGINDE